MTTLVLATANRHKVEEFASMLGGSRRLLSLAEFPEAPKVVEDQPTFAANAMKKARSLAQWMQGLASFEYRIPGTNALVVADDSGLEVDALGGAPGVHSARFAALDGGSAATGPRGNSTDADNNAKLIRLLQPLAPEKRTGRFHCVLAVVRVKPRQPTLAGQTFEGVCGGRLHVEGRGRGGFGYDPLFVPEGQHVSYAEMGAGMKHQISHRARAVQAFRRYLETLGL